ncbi:MAG: 30S ribosomal protein S4 [Candidatus Gracilibacteria bacterium]|nr:30S ribosomal protein S4 [Candidatus Gracilibacteria bacterium]MDD3145561.1 30S ribosomal protein S4 [Candidatus Gracilibacteria bacterium]
MRYTGPKKKLCRREGVNLFGTEKYDLTDSKRAPLRSRKTSEFGTQLRKKQMAKRMFGLSEKQFASYFKKAQQSTTTGTTGDKMLQFLELRLDNVVYRANFARTRIQSRQFVNHAHFTLNGVKVDVPSIAVKVGDVIALRDKLKESALYKTLLEELEEFSKSNKGKVTACKWIDVDSKKLTITIKAMPEKEDFDQIIDIQKIVEFYSK